MATSTNPTFEDVDRHIQQVNLASLKPAAKGVAAAEAVPGICPAYQAVRPILVIVSNIPIIPQKWRDVLKTFIEVVDVICPPS